MATFSSHIGKIDFLKSLEIFKFFTYDNLKSLIKDCEEITLGAGETLFREGDAGDSMFVVLSGELIIEKENIKIASRGRGKYFGEMTLIEDKPRTATVTAISETRVLKIFKDQFHLHFASNPKTLLTVLKTVSKRSRENLNGWDQGMKKLQAQKKLNLNLQHLLNDTSNEIYIFKSSSFAFMSMNTRARDNLGYDKEEINQLNLFDIIGNLDKEKFGALVKPLRLNKKDKVIFKGMNRRKDGSEYPLEFTFKLQKSENSSFFVGIAQDISKLKRIEDKFANLTYYDSLTGLPNKNLILESLNSEILQANGNNKSIAVLLMDLDDFKTVNDSMGRQAGDTLLKEVAQRLQEWSSSIYPIARYGADEFIIILSKINFESEAARAAGALIELFQAPFSIDGQETYVNASFGISYYPIDGLDGETLIEHAETAMYFSKDDGKNTYCHYSSDMEAQAKNKLILERDLRKALELNEFVLYYQPKLELASETIVGFEALVRWNHPTRGLVPPMDFIPLAEKTKLIIPLGEWILRTACKQTKTWLDMGLSLQSTAVNLSAHQFNEPNFFNKIREIILEEGIKPEHLELEITDTVLMDNSKLVASQLKKLCGIGIKISIDDFGTGCSSLSNLNVFPLDYLKIEQAFVQEISPEKDASLPKAIITLAKALNLKTIAEGVETEAQKEVLRSLGCDIIQGYVLSKPLPVAEATKMLSPA